MTNVEHLYPTFQWADPLQPDKYLTVSELGTDLQIAGRLPDYKSQEPPTDIIRAFGKADKSCPIGQPRIGKNSPDVLFANANSTEKLVSFARLFGPVVAKSVHLKIPDWHP